MLYNESTGKPKVAHDIFSLEGLIAWLETMPGDGKYYYTRSGECCAAQYLKSCGFSEYRDHGLSVSRLDDLGWSPIVEGYPRTFSAALTRARTALASQSKSEACPSPSTNREGGEK